jgi:hypothetical protein
MSLLSLSPIAYYHCPLLHCFSHPLLCLSHLSPNLSLYQAKMISTDTVRKVVGIIGMYVQMAISISLHYPFLSCPLLSSPRFRNIYNQFFFSSFQELSSLLACSSPHRKLSYLNAVFRSILTILWIWFPICNLMTFLDQFTSCLLKLDRFQKKRLPLFVALRL